MSFGKHGHFEINFGIYLKAETQESSEWAQGPAGRSTLGLRDSLAGNALIVPLPAEVEGQRLRNRPIY